MAVQQQAMAWVVGNVAYPPDNAGKGGSHRVRLRVLNNRGWYDRANREWVERPANGTEVICWGDLARNAAASIEVGDPVVVYGRLEENLWTDTEGVSHKKTRVVADLVAHDLSRGQARFTRVSIGAAGPQVGGQGSDPADKADVTDESGNAGTSSGDVLSGDVLSSGVLSEELSDESLSAELMDTVASGPAEVPAEVQGELQVAPY